MNRQTLNKPYTTAKGGLTALIIICVLAIGGLIIAFWSKIYIWLFANTPKDEIAKAKERTLKSIVPHPRITDGLNHKSIANTLYQAMNQLNYDEKTIARSLILPQFAHKVDFREASDRVDDLLTPVVGPLIAIYNDVTGSFEPSLLDAFRYAESEISLKQGDYERIAKEYSIKLHTVGINKWYTLRDALNNSNNPELRQVAHYIFNKTQISV